MAKPDWGELQHRFLSDNAKTGVSPKEWCEAQGLNYATARRYIKKPAQSKVRKPAQKPQKRDATTATPKKKANRGNPNPVTRFEKGHKHSVKHNGYSKYLTDVDDLFTDAACFGLVDELRFVRVRILSATRVLNRLRSDFEEADDAEMRIQINAQINNTEIALDRNIARVESLERSISSLGIDAAMLPKIMADTVFRSASTDKTRVEIERIRAGLDNGDKEQAPTPVQININVVDARADDGDQSDA